MSVFVSLHKEKKHQFQHVFAESEIASYKKLESLNEFLGFSKGIFCRSQSLQAIVWWIIIIIKLFKFF